ncbi:MAG: sugar phosphate isomerase/epimerase family protein [Planctomycetaceae bacterium]
MMRLKLAVPTAVFGGSIRRSIQSAAALQPDGLQFDLRSEISSDEFGETACRQFRHLLAEYGVQAGDARYTTQGTLVEAARLDARVSGIKQAMELARRIGSPALEVRLGQVPEDANSRESERLLDVLRDLMRHADRVGVMLALTTLGNTVAQMRSLLSTLGSGLVGVAFDPAGFVFAGESPEQALRGLNDCLASVQLRDGIRAADGAGVETAIGAGTIEWDRFLATVSDTAYQGWLTLRRSGGESPADDVSRGLRMIREVTMTGLRR